MTTTTLTHTCPAWCTLPPDHDAADVRKGDQPIHNGPKFGLVETGTTYLGPYVYTPDLEFGPEHGEATKSDIAKALLDMATDLIAAAEWIEVNG